jgi:hypothetical protein
MGFSIYGLNISESWLASVASTNSTEGTSTSNMVVAVTAVNKKYSTNYTGVNEKFSSWSTLRSYLASGWPVILRVQSWNNPKTGEHYVLLYGLDIDNSKAYLADPNAGKRVISFTDLKSRIDKVSSPSVIVIKK